MKSASPISAADGRALLVVPVHKERRHFTLGDPDQRRLTPSEVLRDIPTSSWPSTALRPLLCRWRFTCETARAASVGALGHGRLPGGYEELTAAR
jgi:hypothetical protein